MNMKRKVTRVLTYIAYLSLGYMLLFGPPMEKANENIIPFLALVVLSMMASELTTEWLGIGE